MKKQVIPSSTSMQPNTFYYQSSSRTSQITGHQSQYHPHAQSQHAAHQAVGTTTSTTSGSGSANHSALKKYTQEDFTRKGSAGSRHPFTEGNSIQQSPQATSSVSPPPHSHVNSLLLVPQSSSSSGYRKPNNTHQPTTNSIQQQQQQSLIGKLPQNSNSFMAYTNGVNASAITGEGIGIPTTVAQTATVSSSIDQSQCQGGFSNAISASSKVAQGTNLVKQSSQIPHSQDLGTSSYSNQYRMQMNSKTINTPNSQALSKVNTNIISSGSNVSSSSSSGSSSQAKNSSSYLLQQQQQQQSFTARGATQPTGTTSNLLQKTSEQRYPNKVDSKQADDSTNLSSSNNNNNNNNQEMGKFKKGITCLNKLIQNVSNETYTSSSHSHRQQQQQQQQQQQIQQQQQQTQYQNGGGLQSSTGKSSSSSSNSNRMSSPAPISTTASHRQSLAAAAQTVSMITASLEESQSKNSYADQMLKKRMAEEQSAQENSGVIVVSTSRMGGANSKSARGSQASNESSSNIIQPQFSQQQQQQQHPSNGTSAATTAAASLVYKRSTGSMVGSALPTNVPQNASQQDRGLPSTQNLEVLASRLSEIAMNLSSPERKINHQQQQQQQQQQQYVNGGSSGGIGLSSARSTNVPGIGSSSAGNVSSMKSSRHASGNLNSAAQSHEQSSIVSSSSLAQQQQQLLLLQQQQQQRYVQQQFLQQQGIGVKTSSSSSMTNRVELLDDPQQYGVSSSSYNHEWREEFEGKIGQYSQQPPHHSSLSAFSPGRRSIAAAETFAASEMYKKPQQSIRKNSNGRSSGGGTAAISTTTDIRSGTTTEYKAIIKERPTTSTSAAAVLSNGHKSEILSSRYAGTQGSSSSRVQQSQQSIHESLASKQRKEMLGGHATAAAAAGGTYGGKLAKKKRQEMKQFRHFSSIDFQNSGGDHLSSSWMNSAQNRAANLVNNASKKPNVQGIVTTAAAAANAIAASSIQSQSKAHLLSLQEKIQLMQANQLLNSLSINQGTTTNTTTTTQKLQNYANTIDYDQLGDRSDDVPSYYDGQHRQVNNNNNNGQEQSSFQDENEQEANQLQQQQLQQPLINPRSSIQVALQLEERLRKLESSPLEATSSLASKLHKVAQQQQITKQHTDNSQYSVQNIHNPTTQAYNGQQFNRAYPHLGVNQATPTTATNELLMQQQQSQQQMQQLQQNRIAATQTAMQNAKQLKQSASGSIASKSVSKSPYPSHLQAGSGIGGGASGSQSYRRVEAGTFAGAPRQSSNKVGDQLIKERRKHAEQVGQQQSASMRESILNGGSIHATSISMREPATNSNATFSAHHTHAGLTNITNYQPQSSSSSSSQSQLLQRNGGATAATAAPQFTTSPSQVPDSRNRIANNDFTYLRASKPFQTTGAPGLSSSSSLLSSSKAISMQPQASKATTNTSTFMHDHSQDRIAELPREEILGIASQSRVNSGADAALLRASDTKYFTKTQPAVSSVISGGGIGTGTVSSKAVSDSTANFQVVVAAIEGSFNRGDSQREMKIEDKRLSIPVNRSTKGTAAAGIAAGSAAYYPTSQAPHSSLLTSPGCAQLSESRNQLNSNPILGNILPDKSSVQVSQFAIDSGQRSAPKAQNAVNPLISNPQTIQNSNISPDDNYNKMLQFSQSKQSQQNQQVQGLASSQQNQPDRYSLSQLNPQIKRKPEMEFDDSTFGGSSNYAGPTIPRQMNYNLSNDEEIRNNNINNNNNNNQQIPHTHLQAQSSINPMIQRDFSNVRATVNNLIDSRDDFVPSNPPKDRINFKSYSDKIQDTPISNVRRDEQQQQSQQQLLIQQQQQLLIQQQQQQQQQQQGMEEVQREEDDDDDEELQFVYEDNDENNIIINSSDTNVIPHAGVLSNFEMIIQTAPNAIRTSVLGKYSDARHRINCVAVQESKGIVVSGSHDYMLRIYTDSQDGLQLQQSIKHRRWVTALTIIDSLSTIVSGCADGLIRIYQQAEASFQQENVFAPYEMTSFNRGHQGAVTGLVALSNSIGAHSSNQYASSGVDGIVQVWDLEKQIAVQNYDHHQTISHLSWDSERHLLISLDPRYVLAQDTRSPYRSPCLRVINDDFTCIAASRSGVFVASGQDSVAGKSQNASGATLSLIDLRIQNQMPQIMHASLVAKKYSSIQMIQGDSHCVLGSENGLEMIDLSLKVSPQIIDSESEDVLALAYNSLSKKLYSGQRNHLVGEYLIA